MAEIVAYVLGIYAMGNQTQGIGRDHSALKFHDSFQFFRAGRAIFARAEKHGKIMQYMHPNSKKNPAAATVESITSFPVRRSKPH